MSTASKIRAILNLVIIIVEVVMLILMIITVTKTGSLNESITAIEKIVSGYVG